MSPVSLPVKRAIKSLIALTPYRIVHRAENRFDAMEYSLQLLRSFGYRPKVVIDAGAYIGEFSRLATRIFPEAAIHMIEPQPSCHPRLKSFAQFSLHPFALGSPEDVASGLKLAVGDEPSTGAHVASEGAPVPAATLDSLVSFSQGDSAFLKMDLQGYELHALRGAVGSLPNVEVILTEVSFFAQAYEPPIIDLMTFLDAHDFVLFDVAALGGRTRDNRLRQGDFVFVRRGSLIASDTRWD